MGSPGWINDNNYRDYPFIPEKYNVVARSGTRLPQAALCDFSAVMGILADFDDATDIVYLHQVRRIGATQLEFEFRTTAVGAAASPLVLQRLITDDDWFSTLIDSDASSSSESFGCAASPSWEAFVTSGTVSAVLDILPNPDDSVTFALGEYTIEPARIQNLKKSFLRSVSIANYDRTRWRPDDECDAEEVDPEADRVLHVNAECLTGHLRFKEGFGCSIRQETGNRTIIFSAASGAGAGVVCEEIPLYDGEGPPEDSQVLSGGPLCTELVKSVNGVGGRILPLIAGRGIDVRPHETDPYTIVVTTDFSGFVACPEA